MNNFPLSVSDLLSDRSFRLTADKLVLLSGVRADLKGYVFLADAVILFASDFCSGLCDIYRAIALFRNRSFKSVVRDISYAIAQSSGVADNISRLIGTSVPLQDVHCGLVIAYLGKLFQNPVADLFN